MKNSSNISVKKSNTREQNKFLTSAVRVPGSKCPDTPLSRSRSSLLPTLTEYQMFLNAKVTGSKGISTSGASALLLSYSPFE